MADGDNSSRTQTQGNADNTLSASPSSPLSQTARISIHSQSSPAALSGTVITPELEISIKIEDLLNDKLLSSASRVQYGERTVPALGGIPLLGKLGQGGMGAVYFGIHPRLRQEVAVKVLPYPLLAQQPAMVERFFREAQIAAKVKSPHLVAVSDVNEEGGLFYQVMEYVSGSSAGAYMKKVRASGRHGLDETEALDICIAATQGLAAAHAEGIVHRDIKPDNILIPKVKHGDGLQVNAAKLADLGLARSEESGQSLTGAQSAMGTPGYMAPEQTMDAKKARKPADVFSMGATVYALLAGQSPFASGTTMEVMMATVQQPHVPLKQLRPDVSDTTVALVDCCLIKAPEKRYVDGAALLEALKVCREAIQKPSVVAQAMQQLTMLQKTPEAGAPVKSVLTATAMAPSSIVGAQPVRAATGATPAQKSRKGLVVAGVVLVGLLVAGGLKQKADKKLAEEQALAKKLEDERKAAEEALKKAEEERKALAAAEARKADDDKRRAEEEQKQKQADAQRNAENNRTMSAAEARNNFTTALNLALDAKKHGEFDHVVSLLDNAIKNLGSQSHPMLNEGKTLLAQAQAEVKKRSDFNAKLHDADKLLADKKFSDAKDAYEAARGLWPNSPDNGLVSKGIAAAEAGIQEKNYTDALAEGERQLFRRDPEEAATAFKRAQAIHSDSKEAADGLGRCAEGFVRMGHHAVRMLKDEEKGVKYFRMAADLGNSKGQFALAFHYENGMGITKDMREAERYYRKSAEQGFDQAQTALGLFYEFGLGPLPKNDIEAAKWYKLAANQGDLKAESLLGQCYLQARGVAKNQVEGLSWVRKAAQGGFEPAQMYLKRMNLKW